MNQVRPIAMFSTLVVSIALSFTQTAIAAQTSAQPALSQPTPSQPTAPQSAPSQATSVPQAPVLQPFVATYEAFRRGDAAGNATMRLVHEAQIDPARWRIDLSIEGNRGFAGILGLNIQQSTVFEQRDGAFRPLSQSTVRKGLFLGRKSVGVYDWTKRSAQWTGDVKKRHQLPVPLQDGDMSGLLINLAIIRDAQAGKMLQYRFVDSGRVRDHRYQAAGEAETLAVGELSYRCLRVARTNAGNDETIVWVAEGVPTPIRILQREDGEDAIDLRLIQYQGN